MKKKAQSAIEFMLIIGAVLFFILILIGIFQQEVAKKGIEKRNEVITELTLTIQNELNIAAKSSDGYTRQFEIPNTIAGKDYSIGIYSNFLYINTTDGQHSMGLPTQNVTGNLIKGSNVIRKINATIFLN